MHASSHMVKTHARPPAGASRPAARAVTASGADDANDRTPGSTPADAVGDTTKKSSTVDELGKQMRGRLCAATDAEKQEARVASHGVDAQHVPAAEQSPQQQHAVVRPQRGARGHAARAAAKAAKAATATSTTTAATTATAATTLDGTAVAATPASVTTTPSLTKAVRRARRR